MADEASEEKLTKGGSLVPVLVTAVVCLALGGAGAFFFLGKPQLPVGESGEPVAEGVAGENGEPAVDPGAEFQERLLPLDAMIVNISGDGYARLLKVKVELECESPEVKAEAEARTPQIRDGILTLVSSKRLSEVTSFEGKALLKQDLQDRFNQMLTSGRVESVLLTEFVVQ